ncbi:hypothetical protein K438DRAFT_1750333 [Mycena galopus ATCC 62051]|nr:hypothetical protein K438DRAFT_1750333 [Mycena galopus ATCC 62051]
MESSKPIPEKRTRVCIACLNCRRRKTKCETNYPGDPCKRCSRGGLACEYIPIRKEQGQFMSPRIPAASGYDSSISHPIPPELQAPVQAYASPQAGNPCPRSGWESTWVDTTGRAAESNPNSTHYLGRQPARPEYNPYLVHAQGYSGGSHESPHSLPYSVFEELPRSNSGSSLAYAFQWPPSFSACSQPQPDNRGALCNCGGHAADFPWVHAPLRR